MSEPIPPGRPCVYEADVALVICERLESGETLKAICRSEGMPGESTVRSWASLDIDGFAARYARAREIGYHAMAEQIIEISDDSSADFASTENGVRFDSEHVQRAKLRVDSRKWLLAKMLPKVYGDKIAHTGPNGEDPLNVLLQIVSESPNSSPMARLRAKEGREDG